MTSKATENPRRKTHGARFGIPDYEDIYERQQRGEKLSPLEEFVFHNEPAGRGADTEFCAQLAALIEYVCSPPGCGDPR